MSNRHEREYASLADQLDALAHDIRSARRADRRARQAAAGSGPRGVRRAALRRLGVTAAVMGVGFVVISAIERLLH